MKLSPLALGLAAVCAGPAALAQSSVQLFGLVDVNYLRVSSDGSNGSVSKLGTDGNLSSRLGFRGTEDLGGGLKAGFWLEAAINPDEGTGGTTSSTNQAIGAFNPTTGANAPVRSGTQGLTFGRRSTVSLSDRWGEIRLGRDYVPGFWNLSTFSPFGTNGVGSSGFMFYPTPSAARITNVRASNSIGYHLPESLGGFYGQAMYALGENSSNAGATKDDGKVTGLRLGYASGPVNVAYGTTRTKISALGDLTQSNIGGSYDFGAAKLMVLWGENKTGGNKTRAQLIGAHVPVGAGQIRVAYSTLKASGVANDASHLALGYVYNLSKRSAVYAHYARITNKNNGTAFDLGLGVTSPGGSSTGYEFGVRHSF